MPRTPAPEAASVTPLRRPLGVVVVDALPVVVAGLARLIDEQPDLEVLATAHDHEAALLALGRIRRSRVVSLVGLGLDGDLDAGWVSPHGPRAVPLARGPRAGGER